MSNEDREENERIATELRRLRNEEHQKEENLYARVDRAEKLWKFIFGIAVSIVLGTVWVYNVYDRGIKNSEKIDKIETRVETGEKASTTVNRSNERTLDVIQVTLEAHSKELESRKPAMEQIRELWWMKENGMSNKEAYERKNGYPPKTP